MCQPCVCAVWLCLKFKLLCEAFCYRLWTVCLFSLSVCKGLCPPAVNAECRDNRTKFQHDSLSVPRVPGSTSNPAVFCVGYAFLLFQDESSVQALIDACIEEDGKLYLCVSSPTIKDKPVSVNTRNAPICSHLLLFPLNSVKPVFMTSA